MLQAPDRQSCRPALPPRLRLSRRPSARGRGSLCRPRVQPASLPARRPPLLLRQRQARLPYHPQRRPQARPLPSRPPLYHPRRERPNPQASPCRCLRVQGPGPRPWQDHRQRLCLAARQPRRRRNPPPQRLSLQVRRLRQHHPPPLCPRPQASRPVLRSRTLPSQRPQPPEPPQPLATARPRPVLHPRLPLARNRPQAQQLQPRLGPLPSPPARRPLASRLPIRQQTPRVWRPCPAFLPAKSWNRPWRRC